MARPVKCRKVCRLPDNSEFMPAAAPDNSEPVILTVDEYEAIRLIDREKMTQEQCSEYMNVARTTAQQIYNSARSKLADVLVEGRYLKIRGGEYSLCDGKEFYCSCNGCRIHRRRCMRQIEGGKTMIAAIPLNDDRKTVCQSFGRAPYYMYFNADAGTTEIEENPAAESESGAGLKAAQFIADSGAKALITPRCGENAAKVLQAAEIAIYKSEGDDAEAQLKAFADGKLSLLENFHAGFHGKV